MERLRAWIRMFFGFSRMETNAFLILLPLLAIFLFSEPVYRAMVTKEKINFSPDASLDSMIAQLHWREPDSIKKPDVVELRVHFHPFDPNQATDKELEQLGLKTFLATRIIRFRAKGGVFRKKEDVLKIYGMDSLWYADAHRWMVFPNAPVKNETPKEKLIQEKLDLNAADSLQLVRVRGIGPVLSKRIRVFRDRLGGFTSLAQLGEIYGIDSITLDELKNRFFINHDYVPVLLRLNTASLNDLINHPYIKRKEAQAIIAYRLQHGSFNALEDLNKIQVLTPEWIEKIRPYLTLE